MIRLAYPWALLLLGSIPVLLILYSLRPRRRRVLLSTLSLWQEALRESRQGLGFQKLLRDLGLLLLLLAALALSLGSAGPQWLTRTADTGDAVLLLDVSASMKAESEGKSRFDQARRRAAELIDRLPQGGRMLIMTTARHPVLRTAFESDRDALHRALGNLEPSDEAGRPRQALTLALSLLRNRGQDRVYFLTDGAFDEGWDLDFEASGIEYLPVGRPGRNVAITRFDFRREVGAEDRFELFFALHNYTENEVVVPVVVTLDRTDLAKRLVTVPAGETKALVLPYQGLPSGRARARIVWKDDLATDNQAFAVLNLEERLRVLLVSRGDFWLESALESLPNALVTRLEEVWPDSFEAQAAAHDIVILDRLPAPQLPPGSYLLIHTVPPGLPFAARGSTAFPQISGKGASPLVRDLDLTGVKIDRASTVTIPHPPPGLERLFWSAETDLALALLHEEIRLVWLGFDVAESSFPLTAAFPVFFHRSLSWLHPRTGPYAATQVPAGETFAIQLPRNQELLAVRTPANQRLRYPVRSTPFLFGATAEAGIYEYDEGKERRYFAVNLTDQRESDINPRAEATSKRAPAVRPGRESQIARFLWPHLAGAGFACLASEWLLWCRRRSSA